MATLEAEVTELRERLERVEEQLARLVGDPETETEKDAFRRAARRAGLEVMDAEAIRRVGKVWDEMGVVDDDPTLTPEKLRERMRQRGLRPEDRVFNTTREEMRAEDER